MKKALLPLLFVLSWSGMAHSAVWSNQNSWSQSWEREYVSWVQSQWSVNIFVQDTLDGRPNPFKGMRTDCADTVYTMRFIFAYLNKLPFAVKDASRGSGTITNDMSRFDGQNEPAKARAMLSMLFDVVSTKSIPNDTYPVAISSSTIKPGGLILTTSANHHSWTIQNVLAIGEPHLVFNSTNGRKSSSRLQQRSEWPTPAWVFQGDKSPSGHAGIRAFRPLAYIGSPVWDVPGYSEEQYRIANGKFNSTVKAALGSRREGGQERMQRMMANVCEDFRGRVGAVRDALVHQEDIGGRCMSASEYDNFSTPSRDTRSVDTIKSLKAAYEALSSSSDLDAKTASQLQAIFGGGGQDYCVLEYRKGVSMGVAEYVRRFLGGAMSSNPNEPSSVRWGEKRGGSSCPKY